MQNYFACLFGLMTRDETICMPMSVTDMYCHACLIKSMRILFIIQAWLYPNQFLIFRFEFLMRTIPFLLITFFLKTFMEDLNKSYFSFSFQFSLIHTYHVMIWFIVFYWHPRVFQSNWLDKCYEKTIKVRLFEVIHPNGL